MKKLLLLGMAVVGMSFTASAHALEIGDEAPAIVSTDIHGESFDLADHEGKIVVLEWTNHQCPYVMKHYDSGNMQKLQKDSAGMGGVEWVSIVSSAKGKQGYVTPEEAMKIIEDADAAPTTQLLDPSGEIGNAYGAKTTPHMFVIDADGKIAYMGAIDDNSSPRQDVIAQSNNYVTAALTSLKAGEPVEVTTTQPYGCAVKY